MGSHLAVNVTVRSRSAFVSALMLLAAFALCPSTFLRPALAEEAPNADVAKLGAWMMGGQLGLAALGYFRNTGAYEQFFDEARSRGKELGIEVKDFPPRPAKSTDGLIAMLQYFNQGDGARIGSNLLRKYGAYQSALYDVSSHLFQMPLLYDLDPTLGDKLVERMRTNVINIGLPDRLWKPVADAIAERKSFDDVRSAVIQMDKDVLAYLTAAAHSQTANPSPEVAAKFKPNDLAAILQSAGYRAEVAVVNSRPRIRTGMNGFNVLVLLYSCDDNSGCGSMQFSTGYAKSAQTTMSVANKWNQEKRYGKAYIDTDGNLALEYDVSFFGGVTRDYIKESAGTFESLLADFRNIFKQ